MKLPEVLEALRSELPAAAHWKACIVSRTDHHGNRTDEIIHYPIFDVSVDDDDPEINLLTDEGASSPRDVSEALDVVSLVDRLQALEEGRSDYSVFSGSALQSVDDEFDVRLDVPLVGIARSEDARVFGFLQFPPEQWEETQ